MQFGEQPDDCTDDIEIEPETVDIKLDTQSTRLLDDIQKKQSQQLRNIEKLHATLLEYVNTQKLRSTVAV